MLWCYDIQVWNGVKSLAVSNHIFPKDSLSLVCAQVVENRTKYNSHNYRLVGLRVNLSV